MLIIANRIGCGSLCDDKAIGGDGSNLCDMKSPKQ